MAQEPLRALIVGLGSMGRRHLANLRSLAPDAEVVVLRHSLTGAKDGEELADAVVYRLDDALEFRPNLAVIASPAPCHVETALCLARAGVHLCIEKPIAHKLDRIDELLEACALSQLALVTAYNFRFCRPLQIAKAAVASGEIGRVLSLRAEVGQYLPDWRPGRDYRQGTSARRSLGGGVLLELSHELDYARWLAGDVASVFAHAARLSDLEIDVEDLAELVLRFDSGAVGSIHLDMIAPAPSRWCRVIGSTGVVEWDGLTNLVRCFSRASGQWRELHPAGPIDRNQMYVDEMRHFLDCVRGEEEPLVSGLDGKQALAIALAARESARQKSVVEMDSLRSSASLVRTAA